MSDAKEEALKLVLIKRRTKNEVIEKLKNKGFSEDEASSAAEYYMEKGYIDHHEYALRYAHDAALIKGFGPYRIKRELHLRGVESDFIENALSSLSFDLFDRMQQKYGEGVKSEKEIMHIYQHYLRKGFAPELIKETLRALYSYE